MKRNSRYWLNLLIAALITLVSISAIGVLWFSHWQAKNYLHPKRLDPPDGKLLRQNSIPVEQIELYTPDETKLAAWYTATQNGALILVAHGYGDRRSEDMFLLFAQHGYGVLSWDFRGHGASGGELVTLGYSEVLDVETALEYALSQEEVEHIGAWGGSMGAATMIRAAARRPEIKALVADSSFATLEDELDMRVPYPLLNPLIRYFAERETGLSLDMVRPIDDIPTIAPRPVFIIQGLADTMVPPDSAQRLFNAAEEPRQLWTEPDVPHLGMFNFYNKDYSTRVITFFDTHLLDQ